MDKCKSKYCNCLYFSTNALSRIMTKMADEEFSITGLSSSYAFLLMTVIGKQGIQPKEISQEMQLAPSTVTRLIEKMEYRGFLKRKQVGRSTEVYVTELGLGLLPKIKEAQENLFNRYTTILGEENSVKLTANIYESAQKLE